MKRKILFILMCAVAAVGCRGPVALGDDEEEGDERAIDNFELIITDEEDSVDVRTTLYVTGVEYPEGVDWRADIGYDISGSLLFLMKDGEKIVEIPVGYDTYTAVDADMHRCIDGHIYTDFSTDDETVVRMDGKELFRYAGREMVRGIATKDGSVYTLGIPRSGVGWTYRRDGDIVLSRTAGEPVGSIYTDNGSIVFSFKEEGTGNSVGSYYVVSNGSATSASISSNVTSVDDLRVIKGVVNYVAGITGSSGRYYFDRTGQKQLEWSASYTMQGDMGIHYDGGDKFVCGSLGTGAGLWRDGSLESQTSGKIAGIAVAKNGYAYIRRALSGELDAICIDNEVSEWPPGYDFLYESCIDTNGENCAIGLVNTSNGDRPALWLNGTITQLDFNGVITSVSYQ